MNNLEKLALTFARECLGWKDAKVVSADPDAAVPHFVVLSPSAQSNTLFAGSDPADVKATTRAWCEALGLDLTMKLEPSKRSATATICRLGEPKPLVVATAQHPCESMLSACIEARQQRATDLVAV